METIDKNFRVPIRYYAVVHMIGLISVIDTLGGVGVKLGSAMGGLPVGTTHLNGTQALEFVRERSSSDDFGRMQRTQVLLSAVLMEAFQPSAWRNLPQFITAVVQTVDTNLPFWQWPRLFFALLRTVFFGMDSRTISREMVTPFQTSGGAQVLAPNWDTINPVLLEMFGRWR